MLKGVVGRSHRFFPSRSANRSSYFSPISCLAYPSVGTYRAPTSSFGCGSFGRESSLFHVSSIYSASDPLKLGIGNISIGRRVSISPAAAATDSSAESAELPMSLRSSPAFLFQKTRGFAAVFNHYGRCYWELSKTRLSMLVVATSGVGYVLGSGHVIDFAGLCCTCAGTMMVAASANTLNQVFEVQNDAKMKRTRQRPLPSGRITVLHAVMWASSMGIAGTALLALKANYFAAGLAGSNLFLYAFVYTPLKQIHPANTWVGALVGAIPPLLGWVAASDEISLNAMLLPAALYFWQIPHFLSLAYLCRNDYIAGGFRMLSLADASGWRIAWASFRNCMYLLPLGFLAYDFGITSNWFALESSLITLLMGTTSLLFVHQRTAKAARRMFHVSLLYLPVFMAGMLLHRLPKTHDEECRFFFESSGLEKLSICGEIEEETNGESKTKNVSTLHISPEQTACVQAFRPPVAYASVAPFPFLPAPAYVST